MSTNTTNMSMGKAVDGDNARLYLETTLGAALDTLDSHDHSVTSKGPPVAKLANPTTVNGSSPAGNGALRIPNALTFNWRNSVNTSDHSLTFDGSDQFALTTNLTTTFIWNGSTPFLTLAANSSPAGAGIIRLPNSQSINWRNASNTNDVSLTFNSSDQLVISIPVGTAVATIGATFIALGSTFAAGGYLRLPNNQPISWRNSGNSADDSAYFDSSDSYLIRPSGSTVITVTSAGGIKMSQGFATNVGFQLNASSFIYSGTGVPSNATGNNGDFYFRNDGGSGSCVYQRRSGSWVATGA